MEIKHLVFGLFLLLSNCANAQFSVGISISGIGYHPKLEKNRNHEFYKWKVDKKGKFVGYAAVTFFVSYRLNDYFGAKLMQSLVFSDCAGQFAGITHFGLDFHDDIIGWENKKTQLSASLGPFWYYRKNWNKMPNYQNDPDFIKPSKNSKWETKFVWHGGQIEYAQYLNEQEAVTLNFLPGYPYLYTFGVGMKRTY